MMHEKYKQIGHLILSILLSLLLFFYATTTNYKNNLVATSATTQKESETYTYTLANVPIDISYDSDKYFISGFSPSVTVELTGSDRVILQRESDPLTRTFHVTADLNNLEIGQRAVELQVTNLPSGLNATLSPAEMKVKIGYKVSRSYTVEGKVYSNQLKTGYAIDKVSVTLDSVKVTSDADTLAQIDHIEAVVMDLAELDKDYSGKATIQAVDADGNVLPVVLSERTTNIQVTVKETK